MLFVRSEKRVEGNDQRKRGEEKKEGGNKPDVILAGAGAA